MKLQYNRVLLTMGIRTSDWIINDSVFSYRPYVEHDIFTSNNRYIKPDIELVMAVVAHHVQNVIGVSVNGTPPQIRDFINDDKESQSTTAMLEKTLWEAIDRCAENPNGQIDKRIWDHLLIYAPKETIKRFAEKI